MWTVARSVVLKMRGIQNFHIALCMKQNRFWLLESVATSITCKSLNLSRVTEDFGFSICNLWVNHLTYLFSHKHPDDPSLPSSTYTDTPQLLLTCHRLSGAFSSAMLLYSATWHKTLRKIPWPHVNHDHKGEQSIFPRQECQALEISFLMFCFILFWLMNELIKSVRS